MAEPRKIVQGGLKALEAATKAVDAEDAARAAGKLKGALEAQQAPMTTPRGTGLPLMPRDQGMYTPREQKDLPRMPKVDKARATGQKPQYTPRMQDLLDSPTARKKANKLIEKGQELGMTEWYGTEPLRQVAMDAGRTPEQFESLMAQLASASQRNPVDKQNQMGSYLYHLSETGQLPENSLLLTKKLKEALKENPSLAEGRTLIELPEGYGSLAQGDIFNRAVLIGQGKIGEALPPERKLGTFYENLLGNLKPVTVDVNAVRGPVIELGDPRWLTTKLVEKDEKGRVINSYKPREMYNTGEMTMREAKQRPGFWEAAPSGSEYAGFEDFWQRAAKRYGIDPAEAQALGWYGSADVTALKTKPELYVDNLERLIKRTAEQTGKTPTEVMNDMVTGKGFLRKQGGAVKESEKDMAEFQKRFALHKATGGRVNIPHLSLKKADGGKIAKGLMGAINKASKAVDAEAAGAKALTAAESEANLAKYLEKSKVKNRAYHATNQDVKRFDPKADPRTENNPNIAGWMTNDPEFANDFASQKFRYWKTSHRPWEEDPNVPSGVNIMPVHLAIENPFYATDLIKNLSAPLEMDEANAVAKALGVGVDELLGSIPKTVKYKATGAEREHTPRGFDLVKSTVATDAMKRLGHDGVIAIENGSEVYAPFKETQIKSATGNRGTYDINEPDITKADGGKIFKGALSALQKATKAVDAETAAKKIEAPTIIVPSKISNVKEAVRRSEGDYGARRVERAADEVPNLEKIYQEEALRRAFTGDNAKALMTMNPRDFEKFAMTIPKSAEQPMMYRGYGSDYHTEDMKNMTLSQYIDHLTGISGGYDAVPFLQVGKKEGTPLPFIRSHEGRHRNRALAQQGEKTNLIELLPTGDLRESLPRRSREEYIDAVKKELGPRIVTPQQDFDEEGNKIYRSLQTLPDIYAKGGAVQHDSLKDLEEFHRRFALHKATGGKVNIPHLSLKRVKKFDGGGMAVQSPEETVTPYGGEKSRGAKIAEKLYELAKEQGKEEVSSLKKPRAATDLLNRGVLANNPVSATVDFLNWGLGGVDAAINAMRSPTMSELVTGKQDKKYLSSEKPFLGSEQIKDLMNKYGVTSGEERPLMETALSFLSPTAVIKGAQKTVDVAKKAPEMVQRATDAFTSSKLSPLATEAKTASAGKPTGATYATKQEGPFFRVRPTALDQSTAKGRGVREADEFQGTAPVGGGAGSSGSAVPTRLSDEEVARIIADPAANEPLNIAKKYTQETQGTEFTLPQMPESSLVKQSAIGRVQEIASEGSPEYKRAIFDAYAREMPEVLEQSGAKNYDDLMEKAYRQMAKETDAQFQALPYNFSYHRAGEGNYLSSNEMAADVHGNKHLYVYQGGDKHDFLNRIDPVTGLNENEKFRAVHDLLGHAIYGNQFGPKGEEVAWAVHSQMYSPLARLAMTAETRGQNSMVNYSPLNANLKAEIAKYDSLASEARRRGDTALLNEINAAKRQAYSGWQYAPNKAVLLPPEFLSPQYAGGMPSYLEAANRPAKGTETQSVLTHFSHNPDLQFVDPKRYGTGIKGAEAERLRDFPGGVRDRSYFYMGEPGAVSPEPGLGVNRYRGEASSLYDITQDPLNFRVLARESNRTPYTAKYNQGITSPLQEANDMERLVKEYGYQGMANPKASKPMAIMFKETPVRRNARGGLTLMK